MAKAFKCDLCHETEAGDPVALLTLEAPTDSFYMKNLHISELHMAELCSKCLESMRAHLVSRRA